MPPPDRGAAGGPARDPAPRLDLDDVDAILLYALQVDARLSQAALGARVGLSAAAVNRRLRRLTDAGVIRRTSAVLAPELLGVPLTVVVGVLLVSERLDLIDEVEASFTAVPAVQQCYYVTGRWDFVLVVLVADMAHYTRLTRELFLHRPEIDRFESLVVMRAAKVSLDVPGLTPAGRDAR